MVQCQNPPESARTFQSRLSAAFNLGWCLVLPGKRAHEYTHAPSGEGDRLRAGPGKVMSVWTSRSAGPQLREEEPGPGSLGSNPHPSTYLVCDLE